MYNTYRNDYGDEEDYEKSGVMLSPPVTSKVLYLTPCPLKEEGDHRDGPEEQIYCGDLLCVDSSGYIFSYNAYLPSSQAGKVHTLAGVALADAKYNDWEGEPTHQLRPAMGPIPVMVSGDVVATIYAGAIRALSDGNYHVGNYIDAEGMVSEYGNAPAGWGSSGHLVVGQILTGKTDDGANTRLYPRYAGGDVEYYHVAVRLCLGARQAIESAISMAAKVDAYNTTGDDINENSVVTLVYSSTTNRYEIIDTDEGALANGVAPSTIYEDGHGEVLVSGSITYTWSAVQNIIAKSPRARIHPIGVKILAARARNEEPTLDEYFVGMRVTEDLLPIMSGVPGNQFGQITEIDPGTPPNGAPTITVSLDPVATFSPAPEAEVDLETEEINEDTPVGLCLVQNPITGLYVPCRCDTDNVDAVVQEATELPTVNGWTLENYRAIYGDGVFYANGKFWKAIKKFAKGVYKKVIKPAAKWAISVVRPLAGDIVSAAGNVLKSYATAKAGALISAMQGLAPGENGYRGGYTSITGKWVPNDEIVQEYVDDSGSYCDAHPNHTYVYDIDEPTANGWVIGDCLSVNASTGKAVKITGYDQPIEAVVNWEPAQDPETNGWKIAAARQGYREIRSNALKVGSPVLYDGTDATNRLAQKLATAIVGYVKEVWQPSPQTLAAIKEGKLPADEELPNCIVEIAPEFVPAEASDARIVQYNYVGSE